MGGDVIGRQGSQCASVKSQHLFLSRPQRISIFATLVAKFTSVSRYILFIFNHFTDDIALKNKFAELT